MQWWIYNNSPFVAERRMVLDHDGDLHLVGTRGIYGTSAGLGNNVGGKVIQIYCENTGTVFANRKIYILFSAIVSGPGTNPLRYNTSTGEVTWESSSSLVKKDIQDCPYGLEDVRKLRPRKYLRTDGNDVEEVGFIADEVIEVMPEFVSMMEKGRFTRVVEDKELVPGNVHYEKMTAVLCKAIQELASRLEKLENK